MTYLIGKDKILCRVTSPLISGWEDCTDVRQLMRSAKKEIGDQIVPGVKWMGTKIPLEQMKKVLGTVHQFPHTECGFILEYRAEDGAWNIELTEQQGQSAFVHWEDTVQHDGFMSMGTIHTHPEMNAFFSGTDHHNDEGQYGVHIVLGLSNGHAVRTACRIYTPTGHYDQDIWDICEKWDEAADYEPVQAWVDIVKKGMKTQHTPAWPSALDISPGITRMFFDRQGNEISEGEWQRKYGDVAPSRHVSSICVEDDETDEDIVSAEFDDLCYNDVDVEVLLDYDMDVQGICHGLTLLSNTLGALDAGQLDEMQDSAVKIFEDSVKLDTLGSSERAVVRLLEHQVLTKVYADLAGVV